MRKYRSLQLFFLFHVSLFVFNSFVNAQQSLGSSDQPAKVIEAPQPVYPREAKELGLGGRVSVRVTIDETGKVIAVDEANGPASVCGTGINDPRVVAVRDAVVDAVRKATFAPALKAGVPVKSTFWIESNFDPGLEDHAQSGNRLNSKIVNAGVINGMAKRLPKPEYPPAASAVRASGMVVVKVIVDETGAVFAAEAQSGHPLLRGAAVSAACKAQYSPTFLNGKPVRVVGSIRYNFVP